jgi:hypothetical protein
LSLCKFGAPYTCSSERLKAEVLGDGRRLHVKELSMASPFTTYSKNKIYRKIIEISPILEGHLFKIRDISQFREISLLKRHISVS